MIDPKPFVETAEKESGKTVLISSEARHRTSSEALGRSGLLCSVEGALVFVRDDFMKPGKVEIIPSAGVESTEIRTIFVTEDLVLRRGREEHVFANLEQGSAASLLRTAGIAPGELTAEAAEVSREEIREEKEAEIVEVIEEEVADEEADSGHKISPEIITREEYEVRSSVPEAALAAQVEPKKNPGSGFGSFLGFGNLLGFAFLAGRFYSGLSRGEVNVVARPAVEEKPSPATEPSTRLAPAPTPPEPPAPKKSARAERAIAEEQKQQTTTREVQVNRLDRDSREEAVRIGLGSPQKIDGHRGSGEWDSAYQTAIPIVLPDKSEGMARLFLMNDRTNLYVAFEFDAPDEGVSQSFSYSVAPKTAASLLEEGTDFGFQSPGISAYRYYDGVRSSRPPCKTGQCGAPDTKWGGSNDGVGRYGSTDDFSFYEFSKPLRSEDPKNDVPLLYDRDYSFGIQLRLLDHALTRQGKYPVGYGDTSYPSRGEKLLIRIASP